MLPTLSARAVSNIHIAHAFAKTGLVGHNSPWHHVWVALPEAVHGELGHFNPQELSNVVWAFATAGHASPELFNTISAEAVRRRLDNFNPQDLSNMAWAFAVANLASADELFGSTSFVTRCAPLEASFLRSDLSQLHQWSLWREERGAHWPGLPKSLQQACRAAFAGSGVVSSLLQSDVAQEIRRYDVLVKEEHRCETSGYSIDALVTLKDGSLVAVEVDGPYHFVGHSQQPTGATLLKHRQLRYFGWRLEIVLYWEWGHTKELPWLKPSVLH